MQRLDFDKLSASERYKLLVSSIVPRPIAFVTSVDESGLVNLAPFSFFNGICSSPPCISISIAAQRSGAEKDTLRNIQTQRQFVVNSANDWFAEQLVRCAAAYPPDVSELEQGGFEPEPSVNVAPPRIKESAWAMECELYDSLAIGDGGAGSSTLIVGRILCMHVREEAYRNGALLIDELQPMARLGGTQYGRISGVYSLPTPKV